ncbi:MAG: tRNA lysidine(34) synthetase TilS [Anaerovoracaceae bacterium]
MKNKILKTITEHNLITDGMHIVLGLSGGPDSVCLFSVLCLLAVEMNLTIHPVHINHKFRPGAAEADQAYVEELCRSRGICCRSFVYDCPAIARQHKLSPEEAGRNVRYEAFFKVAEEIRSTGVPADKIAVAVAHNANDQCETILFRIMRGTGTDGLSGIAYKRQGKDGTAVIRPLLDVTREEIEKYCEEQKLNPRIDHTNSSTDYTRNRIRLELIPYMAENFNENIVETVNRLGKIAAEDRDYIHGQARKIFDKIRQATQDGENAQRGHDISIFTPPLETLHPAIRFRMYNMALDDIGMKGNITRAQMEAVERIRISHSPSASIELTDGFEVCRAYDRLVFRRKSEEGESEKGKCTGHRMEGWKLTIMNRQEYCKFIEEKKIAQTEQTEEARRTGEAGRTSASGQLYGAFSGRILESGAKPELRTRRLGDTIAIKGGTKKLQDFFTDCKVPKMYRDEMLLLAAGNRILWVLPSEHFTDERNRHKGRFSSDFQANPTCDETIIVLEQK